MSRKEVVSSERYTVAFSQGLSRCRSHVRASYQAHLWCQSIYLNNENRVKVVAYGLCIKANLAEVSDRDSG